MFSLIEEVKSSCDEIREQYSYIDDVVYDMIHSNISTGLYDYISCLHLDDYEILEDEIDYIYENSASCEYCGVTGLMGEDIIVTDNDEIVCQDCYENYHRINSYHGYDISDHSSGLDYTMGLELETEFPADHLKQDCAKNYYGDFTMSNDGSLEHGIEFVSPIYDVNDLDEVEEQLKIINQVVVDHRGYCHESLNSGLHVHFCLDVVQDKEKLWDFVYNHKKFFMAVGARKAEFLAFKWCKPYYNLVRVGSHYEVDDRYSLLNINTTYDTIEFRFMNSNLKVDNLLIKIKFLILLIEYTNKYIMPTQTGFIEYLRNEDEAVYDYTIKWYNKRHDDIEKLCNDYFN